MAVFGWWSLFCLPHIPGSYLMIPPSYGTGIELRLFEWPKIECLLNAEEGGRKVEVRVRVIKCEKDLSCRWWF